MDEYTTLADDTPPPRPNFFNRLWMVFAQPGDLFRALGKNPAWFPMALFVAVGSGALVLTTPIEAWEAQMASSGQPMTADDLAMIRNIIAVVAAFSMLLILPFLFSAITYVIFVFMRGDNAFYKQHLSVVVHAGIVNLVGGLVNLPLQMRTGSFEAALSVGSFFPFLPDGYLLTFFNQLHLFGLWTIVVAGIGFAALDDRRSAGSTVAILLVLQLMLALGCAGLATAFSPTF